MNIEKFCKKYNLGKVKNISKLSGGLIYVDLHFDNFIFDGINLHLLNFERCMVAPID